MIWPAIALGAAALLGAAAKRRRVVDPDVVFFRKHCASSYTPGKESKRTGYARSARRYARAEREMKARGWEVVWEHDEIPWDPGDTNYVPDEVLCATLRSDRADWRTHLASLCGIADPSPQYRRCVEAELAMEALYGKVNLDARPVRRRPIEPPLFGARRARRRPR